MPERIWVTVQSSIDHPQLLAVQDAMQQVLDVFEIIGPTDKEFIWNLFVAQRTNPFIAGAEAVSLDGQDHTIRVRSQKARLASRVHSVVHGRIPRDLSRSEAVVVERLLKRNTNGIGRTTISFGAGPEQRGAVISIDEQRARRGLEALRPRTIPHIEIGSIEGWIRSAGFYYQSPAIFMRDRRTNADVTCIISDPIKEKIAGALSVADVWDKRRVIVRGRIRYTPSGSIERIEANDVEVVAPRSALTADDLYDPDFTDGLDTIDYLTRLREGGLGG